MVVFNDTEEEKRLDFLRKREEEELAQILSHKYGVEYVDLSLGGGQHRRSAACPRGAGRDCEAAAFGKVGKRLSLAVRAPENPKVKHS